MDKVVALTKRRGFIFPSSEIYGGLSGFYDYGPYGVALKRAIRDLWWRHVVDLRDDVVGLDSTLIMPSEVWAASGHLTNFVDPLRQCTGRCKKRWRADTVNGDKCPECGGPLDEARMFNLMFRTNVGPVEDSSSAVYLRPETAQGMFVDFKNVINSTRVRVPFGIAQQGRAFRNEITPGNFVFRVHQEASKTDLTYLDPETNERYLPWVIEPAVSVDRIFVTLLIDAYDEDVVNDEPRVVLRLHPNVAPVQVAIVPLSKKEDLIKVARDVQSSLQGEFRVEYDQTGGHIGRRYRRQDEIGTPFCITVDYETLNDRAVTIRKRDTMEQERIAIAGLLERLGALVAGQRRPLP